MSEAEILNAKILIVDDREANVLLLEHLLADAGYRSVSSTMDSRMVVDMYRTCRYDLILLDLNMPHMSGFELIEALKPVEASGYVPVLVVTAEPAHKRRALAAGAKDFISKPVDNFELLTRVHNMLEVRLLYKDLREYNVLLEVKVKDRTAQLKDSYRETIFVMISAAEHRDEDTGQHVKRIGFYCEALAARLGMNSEFRDQILYASPMHDIGKIGIPDHILLKPGGLTPAEWEIMKTHTTLGARVLSRGKSPYTLMGAEIALSHHERWDGGGYPAGLIGEAIPLSARIMNICDIYDALRSKRPYKPAFDHNEAVEIMRNGDGRTEPAHFDPTIFHAFHSSHKQIREIYRTNMG